MRRRFDGKRNFTITEIRLTIGLRLPSGFESVSAGAAKAILFSLRSQKAWHKAFAR
jgi:hypothetical protein